MSSTYIPQALRQQVAAQARYRCGYCLTSEMIVGMPMEIDHIIPQSLGGPTEEANLWLACSLCNDHKSNRIAFLDLLTGEVVRLFDPRRQVWRAHFAWTAENDRIISLTSTGRATIAALHLNRPSLVRARQAWVSAGWYPPTD